MKRFKRIGVLSSLLFTLLASSFASAVTLNVDSNGQLQGASGVVIGGQMFTVSFVDGTCAALFSGCNEVSDFDFSSLDEATAAARALFSQVLRNGPLGNFGSDPSLTNGCEINSCFTLIPFAINGPGVAFGVGPRNGVDDVITSSISANFPFTVNSSVNFARFTPAPVPLPAAAWLFLSAISGLFGLRRYQTRSSG